MADIFISYRRSDSAAVAGRLYDRLSEEFGEEHVFMDIEDISAGQNFVIQLGKKLDQCNTMLILIGPDWLGEKNKQGHRRLDDSEDFVHQEILAALSREISVIPVLIRGASIPTKKDLPPQLTGLSLRQALKIYPDRFHADVDRLIVDIKRSQRETLPGSRWQKPASIAALLLAAVLAITSIVNIDNPIQLRKQADQLSADQVRALLVANDLYDSRWNQTGSGIEHNYEQQVLEGAVVVIDHATDLMWQKGNSRQQNYALNIDTLAALNTTNHAGYSDWRFPTLDEVMSLLQANENEPLSAIFEAGTPIIMTADRTPTDGHWIVYFYDQAVIPESEQFNASLKAVRSLP